MLTKWLSELADHPPIARPLRLLLLERHADAKTGWYHDLADGGWHGDAVRELFAPLEPRHIAPLEHPVERRTVLAAGLKAVHGLRKGTDLPVVMPGPGEDPWFDQRLADAQWTDPLLLLMVAVSGASDGLHAALSRSRQDLALRIAEREAEQVKKIFPDAHVHRLLIHLYACVTLAGGLSMEQAIDVAKAEFEALQMPYRDGPGAAARDLAWMIGAVSGRFKAKVETQRP